MYYDLHVKKGLPVILLMKREFSGQILEKYQQIRFHKNPFSGSPFVPRWRTDGGKDMTELTVTSGNYANAPKNYSIVIKYRVHKALL
jgi:hypothetical protein